MTYQVDRTAQLEEATKRSRFGSVASLRAKGVPLKQHNSKETPKKAEKKTEAPAKKAETTAKKTAAKSPAKKAAKKS
jgi:hypothetical protein